MHIPSHTDSFEVLCLQLAADGRGPVLLGESVERARTMLRPFFDVTAFPDIYLELPLAGDPFLDVTMLYDAVEKNTSIQSDAAAGTEPLFDWYADVRREHPDVSFGFELDTKNSELPAAAVHFQPRKHTELVRPFCELIGEPERADLYLGLNARMPEGWPLSFFGVFRGRPDSPLRVCGYMSSPEQAACAQDASHVKEALDAIGFSAYDGLMLERISQVAATAPGTIDFQFDVYPDGRLGDMFAIDVQFEIQTPKAVRASFADGPAARILSLFEGWGAADDRWRLVGDAAFARSLPVERDDGSAGRFGFTLIPQWSKIRWRNGELQPAKIYVLGNANLLSDETERKVEAPTAPSRK